jgi:hypothetical protein
MRTLLEAASGDGKHGAPDAARPRIVTLVLGGFH